MRERGKEGVDLGYIIENVMTTKTEKRISRNEIKMTYVGFGEGG